MSNNIFKKKVKVEIDSNYYLTTDSFSGVCLVQHYPAKKKNKEGLEVDHIVEDRWYFTMLSQALNKYVELKQIILPEVTKMLEVQKQVLDVLKNFENNYKNWD